LQTYKYSPQKQLTQELNTPFYLQTGVEDILVTPDADTGRADVIERTKDDGMETVARTLSVKHKNNTAGTVFCLRTCLSFLLRTCLVSLVQH